MYFVDTETCGLYGPTILIQWAIDDGPINIHNVWTNPIYKTLELIEDIVDKGLCGFNLAFDWFHLCQTYTVLRLLDKNQYPQTMIYEYAITEPEARFGPCLKPRHACDLLLHARKGPYQSTMDRKPIYIRRVPLQLAWKLAAELDRRIKFKDVYFARRKDASKHWRVTETRNKDKNFRDIELKFAPSSGLKALAADALGYNTENIRLFSTIDLSKRLYPIERGYAPYALAISDPNNGWRATVPLKQKEKNLIGTWPAVIEYFIDHWEYNESAREYASDDVKYTRELYNYFGRPESDDDDSILACSVAACRWKGYKLNIEGLKKLRAEKIQVARSVQFKYTSPKICRRFIESVMSPMERIALKGSTKKQVLEEIAKWKKSTVHDACSGMGCKECDGGLLKSNEPHPAAVNAKIILNARRAAKEVELYDKLLMAGRLHASYNVIGTKSSRMSGADKLNATGIKRDKNVRKQFPLADEGNDLNGGDFESFEVVLMDAAYKDPILHEDLTSTRPCHKCGGTGKDCKNDDCVNGQEKTKIHGIMGTFLFHPMTYDEVLATKGLPDDEDKYSRSKNGVFAVAYFGNEDTLQRRVGVDKENAITGYNRWRERYHQWDVERLKVMDMFCSMKQPGGLGTKVIWSDPAEYVESLFGFKRYFTLENQVGKALFNLANNPPKDWSVEGVIFRREREQTPRGAVCSALYGAAFGIQGACMRAAGNHKIQSSGGTLTKKLQVRIWDLQPVGIHEWHVQPMNIHDELLSPTRPDLTEKVAQIVKDYINEYKRVVPLLAISWKSKMKSWAEK